MVDKRGRPRSFDREQALEKALGPFWYAGYLAASYSDICAATGLTKPSLYAAFGNKEELFLAALEFYMQLYVRPGIEILKNEPVPHEAIHKLLIATALGLTAEHTPPGCLIATNSACAAAPNVPIAVVDALRAAANETPNAIADRLANVLLVNCRRGLMSARLRSTMAH